MRVAQASSLLGTSATTGDTAEMEMHWTFQQEQTPPGGSPAGIPDDGTTGPDGGPKAATSSSAGGSPSEGPEYSSRKEVPP